MQVFWCVVLLISVVNVLGERNTLIGGNWKCNGKVELVKQLIGLMNDAGSVSSNTEVVVAAPSIHLPALKSNLRSDFAVSAEDVGVNRGFGAFTGEISADMLVDFGIGWTIVGHSERRVGFGMSGEPDDLVGRKAESALGAGMSVIACIGEHLTDRENGSTMTVLSRQLAAIAAHVKLSDWSKVVIAYEPVWAIGTGKVATPEQAEETHKDVRQWIASSVSPDVAESVRIIYGGSVKANNCKALIAKPNIDGFLVGGASLLPEFIDIIRVNEHVAVQSEL